MKISIRKATFKIPVGLEQYVYLMPFWQKVLICIVAFSIPCIAFWFLFLAPRLHELDGISGKIPMLRREVMILQKKAKMIPELEAELKEMDKVLKKAMRLLPESKDIPAILTEISSLGNEEHLDFLSFKPGAEIKREFYAEIPVSLSIQGPFHNTMRFFDKITKMARIVHIRDISMGGAREEREIWSKTAATEKSPGAKTGPPINQASGLKGQAPNMQTETAPDRGPVWIISTKCTAVTYRFLTEEEQKAQSKEGKKAKKQKNR